MNLFRVAAVTNPTRLGQAIAKEAQAESLPKLQCIGAAAVNTANKAVASANKILEPDRQYISAIPELVDMEVNGEQRKGIQMQLMLCMEKKAGSNE